MAASIKCCARPFRGGSWGAKLPQPKTGESAGRKISKINYENNDSISNYCNNLGFILENKGSMASSKIKSKENLLLSSLKFISDEYKKSWGKIFEDQNKAAAGGE